MNSLVLLNMKNYVFFVSFNYRIVSLVLNFQFWFIMRLALNAIDVQRMLNGFLCVYKPRDISLNSIKKMLINAICTQGNELGDSEVPTIEVPIVEPHPKSQALVVVGKRKQLDYRFVLK